MSPGLSPWTAGGSVPCAAAPADGKTESALRISRVLNRNFILVDGGLGRKQKALGDSLRKLVAAQGRIQQRWRYVIPASAGSATISGGATGWYEILFSAAHLRSV